jgi:replicative DNA helicase
MMETTETLILRNLIYNEDFTRKVLPFIKTEYFIDNLQQVLYEEIASFINEYNSLPTKEALTIELEKRTDLNETSYSNVLRLLTELNPLSVDKEWLLKTTEQWCKDRAVYLAINKCIHIADGQDSKLSKESIPSILSDALAVSFDSHVGHDYIDDAESRYESYTLKEEKLPFDLTYLNRITGGGLFPKTLLVMMAPPGVGKSLFMCHFATSYLLQGKNVLYITLEMSEKMIAQRIDANLLDINIQDLTKISKSDFEKRVQRVSNKTQGKLIIKEYPTSSAHCGHFRTLFNELKLKRSFVPDVILVDYLNICTSSRLKNNGQSNSYTINKYIAEELRSLGVEFNIPVITANQVTRGASSSSDITMADVSESFAVPQTSDCVLAIISTEELEAINQIMVKQIKNRYGPLDPYRRFTVGIDRAKMRLYDVEQEAQQDIIQESDLISEKRDLKSKFKTFNFE